MRPYIKLHTRRLDDTRLLHLGDRTQATYWKLYMLAGLLDADGSFIENGRQLDEKDIALKLRIRDIRLFQVDIKALRSKGTELLGVNGHGLFISDFKEEQPDWEHKKESDRERQARKRSRDNHAPVTRDKPVTEKPSRVSRAPRLRIKTKTKTKTQIKNPPTQPTPPAKTGRSRAVAGRLDGTSLPAPALTAKQKKTAEAVRLIWTAFTLRHQKLENLVSKVATRSLTRQATRLSLAAIASALADDTADNKQLIAAHRAEHDEVPAEFFNPEKWTDIPEKVLQAAGIDNLQAYIRQEKLRNDPLLRRIAERGATTTEEE